MGRGGPLVIAPPRQAGKALGLEQLGDGGGAERGTAVRQRLLDVIDRQVLLAQSNHLVAQRVTLGGTVWSFGGGQEELALGVGTELMTQDAETAGGVAEAAGDFVGGQRLDEVGAQGFVLAVRGIPGPHEVAGEVC